MLGFAAEERLPAVLTNAVRYADRSDAPTADVLDASRRLVAARRPPRRPGQRRGLPQVRQGDGARSPSEVARAAGLGERGRPAGCSPRPGGSPTGARSTRAPTSGMGEVHFPELEVLGGQRTDDPVRDARRRVLRERCEAGLGRRAMAAPPARSGSGSTTSSAIIETLGYPSYFLTVADVVDLIREHGGAGRGARLGRRQPGQLPARHLRRRPDPRTAC